jgi:AGZA family xanthine/uracil permease-like MFS transporter
MIPVPAEPFPSELDPAHVALRCIDFQRDFVEPGGLHSLRDEHPGMYEAGGGEEGASITGELYQAPTDVLLRVVEHVPTGLYRGPVQLAVGRVVPGILSAREPAELHPDITAYGDWRQYRATVTPSGT